ncbi:MAG: methyltransferase domain-containing protein [Acidimicrobiales bacterium]
MEGYDASTYGERFADVYDDWYAFRDDTPACVEAIAALAGGGAVLELGVGTGRLAIPLAARGLAVTGVDTSPAMLERLAAKPGGDAVTAVLGDMADPPVGDATFAVVFVAYNTLFNLVGDGEQQRCLANAAARLAPGGSLVIEAFVPDPDHAGNDGLTVREITADQVVLSISRSDPARQEVLGQFVDITEAGITLRPWHVRWSTPEQLDAMATAAGLALQRRAADWTGTPWTDDAPTHVSTYRHA